MTRDTTRTSIRGVTAAWQRLVEPLESVKEPERRQQSQLLASLMLMIALLVAALIGVSALFSAVPIWQTSRFLLDLVITGTTIILYIFSRKGYNRLVAWLFVIVGSVTLFSWVIYLGAESGIYMMYYLTAITIFSAFFLRSRAALLVLAAYVAVTALPFHLTVSVPTFTPLAVSFKPAPAQISYVVVPDAVRLMAQPHRF